MGRRLLWRGALVAAGLLVAAEIALRSIGFGNPPLLVADPDIGYLFASNQDVWRFGNRVAINRFHQRSPEVSPLPDAGTERILVIGDSVTFGGALADQDETYPQLLAALLREDGPVEVLNASAGSWAIGNELAYLERFGLLGSDILIVQIGSHDLVQPTSVGDIIGVDPNYPARKPSTAIGEVVWRYLLPRVFGTGAAPAPPGEAANEAQFERNMASFAAIVALARAQGAKVIVLHTPNLYEVEPGQEHMRDPYRERFLGIVEDLDLRLINLAAEWRDTPGVATYYRDGTHLSVDGNAAVAERLAREVGKLTAPAD